MNKLLKTLVSIVVVILVLVMLGFAALVTMVSPNKLKPLISTQVLKYTGRQLTIDGDLSWTLFPYLAVKIGHASLNNPDTFKEKTFAEFDSATVGVKLVPLIRGSIESNGVTLSGFKIHLIKNAAGQSNWEIMQQAKPAADPSSKQVLPTTNNNVVIINFQIPIISVDDASVTWSDEKTGHYVQIDKFDLEAKDISSGHSFPITSSLDFTSKKPDATGHVKIKGDISLNLGSKTLSKVQQIGFTGTMQIDSLQVAKLKMTDVNINTQLKEGVLNLAPMTAAFYAGKLQGESKVDLNTAGPGMSLHVKLADVQINPIINDMETTPSKYQLKGAANIDLQLTTNGNDPLPSLNGSGNFSLKNSVLEGVNIDYMIDTALAMIKVKGAPAQGANATNLGSLTGSLSIKSGVISNNDLVVTSPRFNTTGQGTMDLVNQRINYKVLATPTGVNLTIPVFITGDLQSPNFKVDKDAMIGMVAAQQIKNVGKDLTKTLISAPGQAGSLLKGLFGH